MAFLKLYKFKLIHLKCKMINLCPSLVGSRINVGVITFSKPHRDMPGIGVYGLI